jgi:hypothetical protein
MAKLQLSDMDYVGQIDASGAPHGLGQCTFRATGANHKGHFQHGAPFGPGTRYEPKEEKLLAGQWQAHGLVQGEYWFPAVKSQKRTGVTKSMTGDYTKKQVDPKFAIHAEAAAKEATELIEAWARDGGLDVDAAQEDVDMTQACKPRSNRACQANRFACLFAACPSRWRLTHLAVDHRHFVPPSFHVHTDFENIESIVKTNFERAMSNRRREDNLAKWKLVSNQCYVGSISNGQASGVGAHFEGVTYGGEGSENAGRVVGYSSCHMGLFLNGAFHLGIAQEGSGRVVHTGLFCQPDDNQPAASGGNLIPRVVFLRGLYEVPQRNTARHINRVPAQGNDSLEARDEAREVQVHLLRTAKKFALQAEQIIEMFAQGPFEDRTSESVDQRHTMGQRQSVGQSGSVSMFQAEPEKRLQRLADGSLWHLNWVTDQAGRLQITVHQLASTRRVEAQTRRPEVPTARASFQQYWPRGQGKQENAGAGQILLLSHLMMPAPGAGNGAGAEGGGGEDPRFAAGLQGGTAQSLLPTIGIKIIAKEPATFFLGRLTEEHEPEGEGLTLEEPKQGDGDQQLVHQLVRIFKLVGGGANEARGSRSMQPITAFTSREIIEGT